GVKWKVFVLERGMRARRAGMDCRIAGVNGPGFMLTRNIYAHAKYLCSREINVAALRIGADQFDAKLVSHIHTVTLDKQAFHMRLEYPHKSSLGRGSRHDGVKYLANAAAHAHGGDSFRHSALNFSRCVLFQSAVGCNCGKFVIRVRTFLSAKHRLDESLRNNIGITAVG